MENYTIAESVTVTSQGTNVTASITDGNQHKLVRITMRKAFVNSLSGIGVKTVPDTIEISIG